MTTFYYFFGKVLKVFFYLLDMVENGSKKLLKVASKYYCEKCDYTTSKKSSIDKHILTIKHKMVVDGSKKLLKVANYECECGKQYKYDSGYYRHRKNCNQDKDALVIHLLKQNGELQNKIIEMSKQSTQITNNTNNTNNNNNSHNTTNNAFNLNFFLNETCKNAMNITDFVSSIKMNLDDLEHTGRQGYIQGISSIILKNLNNLEQHMRPLHCSNSKHETLYIKDNNEWTKETEDKPILTNAIKIIANKNIKQISTWRDSHLDCTNADSKKNNLYLKIVSNSMNDTTEEDGKKNMRKIISNVVKEVIIDKSK